MILRMISDDTFEMFLKDLKSELKVSGLSGELSSRDKLLIRDAIEVWSEGFIAKCYSYPTKKENT